jgi:hypothetical protein
MPSIKAKCRIGLLWCRAPRGREAQQHHLQMSTSPPGAESVTHSGKICGSPRFALLQTAAL